jgi:glutathione peroxidase
MNIRQRILKVLYPLIRKLSKLSDKGTVLNNKEKITPKSSFYQLKMLKSNGELLDFSSLKNKKVLLVNTASDCGFTGQFDELQKLHETNDDKLMIIGFPANDFKEQERHNDEEISQFCRVNYGVSFPLAKKSIVVKGLDQNPIYTWLTSAQKNGWNDHQPDWNFSKYLINENGVLTHYFGPSISPLSKDVLEALNKKE